MFDYLQQFNKLPKDLRDQVSSPSAMATISELETKYKVDLAIVIMKVMVKSVSLANLPLYLSSEFSLPADVAEQLARDLKEKVFSLVAGYLGISREITAFDQDKEIEEIIKEAGLILPSSLAVHRFKTIISTYNRGIRNKIDTKNTLGKSYKIGGLDLTPEEVERVLRICDNRLPKNSVKAVVAPAPISPVNAIPSARLERIVASADSAKPGAEYNLRQAIASGQVKKIPAPEKELDLPLAEPAVKTIAAPVIPVKPIEPIKPIIPVKPIEPIKPIAPVKPVEPVKPIEPIQPIQPIKPVTPVKPIEPIKPVVPVKPIAPIKPIAASRPTPVSSSSKKVMQDVKPVPKVMGPIEELQFLDLLNFRRLGRTPAEIVNKIFSKIKLLEAEGYDKMVAGVHAWRQSPVNRLYLKMGQEAMNKNMTLKDFAAIAEKDSQNYLKLEEIEAILVLNSKLVF